ncbi:hypothetical protein BE221DRAFT_115363 [Ostreococcus tauri]|uniref:Uncharacterized protein n=1 Tax=Ostreococcus tauri TaxID=70448 RepID=A0A1Y5IBL0_OSTTA|nr:hypothetical protein BE221DRAFT_115363 [Ostreococcus tauri]
MASTRHDCTNTGSYSTFRTPNQFSPNENKLLTSDDDREGGSPELDNPLRARVGDATRRPRRASLMKALVHPTLLPSRLVSSPTPPRWHRTEAAPTVPSSTLFARRRRSIDAPIDVPIDRQRHRPIDRQRHRPIDRQRHRPIDRPIECPDRSPKTSCTDRLRRQAIRDRARGDLGSRSRRGAEEAY